jgi:hypothetical protein
VRVQKLPTGVFVALAVLVLALGAVWWTSARPTPAGSGPATPSATVLVPSIGRLFTVEQRSIHRRCGSAYQSLRTVGQDGMRRC